MFNEIMIVIMVVLAGLVLFAYMVFPRQTKNFAMKFFGKYRKRYVICHMRYPSGNTDEFLVVQNAQGLTKVGTYSYELIDKYIMLTFKKRAHFVLDENNVIPVHAEKQTNDSIIFQAAEIQTALDNTVMEYLFSKRKELLMIGLFVVAIVATLAIIYNIYELQAIKAYITNAPVVVK